MKRDRLIFGAFSGIIGGIMALLIWDIPAKLLGLTDRTFYDFGMSLIEFHPKKHVLDYLVGLVAHLTVSGIHGIAFACIIYFTSSRYFKLKGILFGFIVWFINLGVGTLFKVPSFTVVPASAALVTWVASGL